MTGVGVVLSTVGSASMRSQQTTLTYDLQINVTSVTDARGKVTTDGYVECPRFYRHLAVPRVR